MARIRKFAAAMVMGALGALAQTPPAAAPATVQMEPLRPMQVPRRIGILAEARIGLQEVIERLLANDPDLETSRIALEEAGYSIRAAKGYFDPVVGLKTYRNRVVTPSASLIAGAATGKITQEDLNATSQVSGVSPWLGGSYTMSFSNDRMRSDSQLLTINPQYSTAVSLNLTQPLWGGLLHDQNRTRLQVARKNQRLTAEQFRQRVMETATQAVVAYWELDYAWRNLEVQTEAVRLAERQYESNRRQAEQGTEAPIDVVAAQTQVATYQQSLYVAQQTLTQAENTLKTMILPNRLDVLWNMALVPETPLSTDVALPNLEEAVKQALQHRPEMAESGLSVDINRLNTRLYGDQVKPRIDAFANLTASGLAGWPVPLGSSPFAAFFPSGSAVPGLLVGSYGQSISNLAAGNFPTVQVGLQVSLPLRNRTASANLATSAAEGRRLRIVAAQVGMAIEADVRNALQALASARAKLEAATLARRSAEEQYSSEQRQFHAGTSSMYLVLQRQTEFITARGREVRARADAGEASVNLDRATARTIEAQGIRLLQP